MSRDVACSAGATERSHANAGRTFTQFHSKERIDSMSQFYREFKVDRKALDLPANKWVRDLLSLWGPAGQGVSHPGVPEDYLRIASRR